MAKLVQKLKTEHDEIKVGESIIVKKRYMKNCLWKIFNISVIFRPIFKRFSLLYAGLSVNYTGKKIFRKKRISRPPGWSFLIPPGRQETDFFFSVA